MCCCAASESVYVDTIAPMFGLDHNCPIWIVKKDGNIAVWPCGGTFSGPQVTVGAVYEVKGQSEPKPTSESPLSLWSIRAPTLLRIDAAELFGDSGAPFSEEEEGMDQDCGGGVA